MATGLVLAVLWGVVGYHVLHWRIPGSSEALLEQADEKSWVNNWIAAEPLYRQAELGFIRNHELSKALYARVSEIPAPSGIGMPGIEKRIARLLQFYSRVGFVHEFRPLDRTEMQKLLERHWTPVGVTLLEEPFAPEVIARLIRMTGGNFRLLSRLLTQIERVLNASNLQLISSEVVEAARDGLVIGQS